MSTILKRAALCAAVVGVLYFSLFDTTPQGTECKRSSSPNGVYLAELCLLRWVPGGDSSYSARVFDAKSGKKLAQHTFDTTVPELSWSPGVTYSLGDGPLLHDGPAVSFSRGGDKAASISLPPSKWDRLLAARPHL